MNVPLRNGLIVGILAFTFGLVIYVSVPDYPYDAKPWEIQLWGEDSQWWSEMTWILLFAASSCSILLLWGWTTGLYPDLLWYRRWAGVVILLNLLLTEFHFAVLHASWRGFAETVLLDRGGYLHGAFYALTTHLVVYAFVLGLLFVAHIARRLRCQTRMRTRKLRRRTGHTSNRTRWGTIWERI